MNQIAALISGEPRYWRDFDLFLEHTQHLAIDWHILHWTNSPNTDKGQVVAKYWQYDLTEQRAREKLRANLPPNHTIATIHIEDQSHIPIHKPCKERMGYTTAEATSKMMWGWQKVCSYKQQYEQQQGYYYNYTIRLRPDIRLTKKLNWDQIIETLKQKPQTILADFTDATGSKVKVNDYAVIGLNQAIDWYCQVYNYAEDLNHNQNRYYNPLDLTYYHCLTQGYRLEHYPLHIALRGPHYQKNNIDFGNWA